MSSHDTVNPTGGVNMGHVMESPDPNDHLLGRVLSRENMQRAWKRVKANKGASGSDAMSIEEFPRFVRNNWDAIRESLLAGTYQPLPVLRVEIPKATGGTRLRSSSPPTCGSLWPLRARQARSSPGPASVRDDRRNGDAASPVRPRPARRHHRATPSGVLKKWRRRLQRWHRGHRVVSLS